MSEPMYSGSYDVDIEVMGGFVPLHSEAIGGGPLPILGIVSLAAAGSAVLLGLALGAFRQRQSRPYLLVVAALVALLGRSATAGFSMAGLISPEIHHVLEHGLDVILVGLLIAAVYHSQTVLKESKFDR